MLDSCNYDTDYMYNNCKCILAYIINTSVFINITEAITSRTIVHITSYPAGVANRVITCVSY